MCNDHTIYMRPDILPVLHGGYEIEDNDMDGWSLYLRIDDSVLRITFMDFESGLIKYELITPEFSIPPNNYLSHIFSMVIEDEIRKRYMKEEEDENGVVSTPYKIITWR